MNEVVRIKETELSSSTTYIGSGKFGRVFASRYNDKNVVYKIMKHGIGIKMFLNELTIMNSLQGHNGIIGLYGYTLSPSKMIIVLEQAKGITLQDFISYYDIPFKSMLTICRQVVSTMIYIHSKNIIYCDMKPDNIIIDPESYNIKLIDFGFSIQLDPSNTVIRGNVCGTTGYIAPEVIYNGCYGTGCDVYSFGVLLYVLHTSNLPTQVGKMKKLLKREYHPEVYKLFCKCTEFLPKNRPTFLQIYNILTQLENKIERRQKIFSKVSKFFCCLLPMFRKQ